MASLGDEADPGPELEGLMQQAEAARVLDVLERAGGVPPDSLATARSAYQQLQHGALNALSDLATLQQRMSQLLAQLQQVQVQHEVVQHGFTDPIQIIDKFREDREQARLEAIKAINGEEAARSQAEALQQRLALLTSKLTEAEEERRAELAPVIRAAKEELGLLRSQLESEQAKAVAAQREADDIASKLDTLEMEVERMRSALGEEQDVANAGEVAPSRARHQADLATVALRQAREEEGEVAVQLRAQEVAEQAVLQECKELVQQHAAAVKAVDRLRNRVGVREREVEEVARDVEMAKVEMEKLLAEQVVWDLEVEKKMADAKREADTVRGEQRGWALAQQRLNRAELEAKQVAEVLPGLHNTIHNLCSQLGAEQRLRAHEADSTRALQEELAELVEVVLDEKKLTGVQAALVRASMADVRQLDEECAALREAAAERETAIRAVTSQRDASVRFLNQRLQRLGKVIDEAEAKDGEVEELHKKKAEARAGHRELRDLCGLMGGQMGRFQAVLGYARKNAEDLEDKVQAAEGELAALKDAAEGKAKEAWEAERARAHSQADRATLAAQLAAARRAASVVAEAADTVAIERELVARGVQEGQEACERLRGTAAAALSGKQAAQRALLERSEEMCCLYERSSALQQEVDAGTVALQHCSDDMRVLQLEVAELQRCLNATHKTTPNVAAYDRQIAALKAEVLRARREAEGLGTSLESPADSSERWRVLPGRLPGQEDLTVRIAQIEERLAARGDLSAQKDSVLEELEALTEGLVEQARAGHHPALDLGLRMNEARRAQQQLTRRMMATVSELSLYQALSLKCAADRDSLKLELAAAQLNVVAGRAPTTGADQEYERMERDRAAEAEVRAQAAELRQLKADGLLGMLRSTALPRPQAYIPEDQGVPKPFLAAFRPFKPTEPPTALAQQQHHSGEKVAATGRSPNACGVPSPRGGSGPSSSSPVPVLAGVGVA